MLEREREIERHCENERERGEKERKGGRALNLLRGEDINIKQMEQARKQKRATRSCKERIKGVKITFITTNYQRKYMNEEKCKNETQNNVYFLREDGRKKQIKNKKQNQEK